MTSYARRMRRALAQGKRLSDVTYKVPPSGTQQIYTPRDYTPLLTKLVKNNGRRE